MDLSVCRLCCNNTGTAEIFDTSNRISKKIVYCTRIHISEEDGLPRRVCSTCAVELSFTYQFILKCEAADEKLRSERLIESESKPDIELEKDDKLDEEDNFHNLDEPSLSEHLSEQEIKPDVELEENKIDKEGNSHHLEELTLDSCQDNVKLEVDFKSDIEGICLEVEIASDAYQNENDKSICSAKSTQENEIAKKKQKKHKHKVNKNIQCKNCGRQFKNPSTLALHLRSHSDDRPYACSSCDKKYKDHGSLSRHIQTNHNTERKREFICETCGKGFYTKNAIKIHFRTHTGETPYACDICPAKFTQIGTLISHKHRHRKEKPHACTICHKTFVTKTSLNYHQVVHSSEKNYACTTCNTRFKHKNNLRKHIMAIHSQTEQYICDCCSQIFTNKGNLRVHIKNIHSDKSGLCSICSKNVPDMEVHMLRHNGIKSFKCDLCFSSFFLLRSLSRHKNFRHKNNEKFKCNKDGCAMTFPSRPMLKFHEAKFHGSEVNFPCDTCSKVFFRKSDLTKHKSFYHKKKLEL